MKTPRELATRYPYMFKAGNFGISICKGWFPTFAKLCDDIDFLLGNDKSGFHWTQVKEKFGIARFYWSLGEDSGPLGVDNQTQSGALSCETDPSGRDRSDRALQLMKQISAHAHAAEEVTESRCAVCGEAAPVDFDSRYMFAVCQTHASQRRDPAYEGFDMWFDKEDDFGVQPTSHSHSSPSRSPT